MEVCILILFDYILVIIKVYDWRFMFQNNDSISNEGSVQDAGLVYE